MNQKGFAPILLILLAAVVLGFVGWYWYSFYRTTPTTETSSIPTTVSSTNPSPSAITYKAPSIVRADVIYPGAELVDKQEVQPCITTDADPNACRGSLGESGGVRFNYKAQAPYKDVVNWYKTKWNLIGGGGSSNNDSGDSGTVSDAHITEKDPNKYLYYLSISGDKSNTTITFSANSNTNN